MVFDAGYERHREWGLLMIQKRSVIWLQLFRTSADWLEVSREGLWVTFEDGQSRPAGDGAVVPRQGCGNCGGGVDLARVKSSLAEQDRLLLEGLGDSNVV